MTHTAWEQLLDGWPWFRGEGNFPLLPYSEFMPPVRLGRKPYPSTGPLSFRPDDPWGWEVSEYEEHLELRPGLADIARHLLDRLVPLFRGDPEHGISEHKLRENPYWPADLAGRAPALQHERFVLLVPLALSLTQDDRGHLRWTLFGNSEQGPARPFWKGFYTAPDQELPAGQALAFFRTLLSAAFEEPAEQLLDLRRAGFRILPLGAGSAPFPDEGKLPSWSADYLLGEEGSVRGVNYLLTFRPFGELPPGVRRKYLAGKLHLLPCPASLLFWGVPDYARLGKQMHLAGQAPLLNFLERHEALGKIRIPQSGWFQEAGPGPAAPATHHPLRDTYKRTYRQARIHRFADSLATAREHRLAHVLFSTSPHDIGLYHKPMARNVQLWTGEFQPLLDGPRASAADIRRAAEAVAAGGLFGYRFLFPAMHVGRYELYWHRPLAAYLDRRKERPALVENAPTGYLTAYRNEHPDTTHPLELWPRLLHRQEHSANVELFSGLDEEPPHRTLTNVRKLLDARERLGRPLPPAFARQLLTLGKRDTLEGWLRHLPAWTHQHDRARALADALRALLAAEEEGPGPSLTFEHTANRAFEERFWSTIATLSAGDYMNKNNADCILDDATQGLLVHRWRDLERLGDYLLSYYAELAATHGMADVVRIGELPFRWHTEYPFHWMGGWVNNQEGRTHERNLLVMVPGRDRSRAVLLADHYDTAYMHDLYESETRARLAAPGADDNCSATAALMLGAPVFLELSRQGRLACDVWLLHLTGEEYPAEGQGAAKMCQWLVEGTLALQPRDSQERIDLSGVHVQGIFVLDMIAHNSNRDRDVFQISPGASR